MKPKSKNLGKKSDTLAMSQMGRVHHSNRVNRLYRDTPSFKPVRGGIILPDFNELSSFRSQIWRDILDRADHINFPRDELRVRWNRGRTQQYIDELERLGQIEQEAIENKEIDGPAPQGRSSAPRPPPRERKEPEPQNNMKQRYYREAKTLARQRGIPFSDPNNPLSFVQRGSTTQYWRNQAQRLQTQPYNFRRTEAREGMNGGPVQYRYTHRYDPPIGANSDQITQIFPFLRAATSYQNNNQMILVSIVDTSYLRRTGLRNSHRQSFGPLPISQLNDLLKRIVDEIVEQPSDTDAEIDTVEIIVNPPRNQGGCGLRSMKTLLDMSVDFPKAKLNNCFFLASKKFLKLTKSKNMVRRDYKLSSNTKIPCEEAIKIFQQYKIDKNAELMITVNGTPSSPEQTTYFSSSQNAFDNSENQLLLMLLDNHYGCITYRGLNKKCKKCYATYKKVHNCIADKEGYKSCLECGAIHHHNDECNVNKKIFP